jgi:hypothetical protein
MDLAKGQALSYFEHHLRGRLEAEYSELPGNKLIERMLRDIDLEYIPKHAIRVQKDYMRQERGLHMGLNTSLQLFVDILNEFNFYLLLFTGEYPKQFNQNEIIEILNQSKAWDPEWYKAMVNANIDIF